MSAVEVLDNPWLRLLGVPAGAVVVTAGCRWIASCAHGHIRGFLKFKTFDIGIDLMVLALLTIFTGIISRSAQQRDMSKMRSDKISAAEQQKIDQALQNLADHQDASLLVLVAMIIFTIFICLYTAASGYEAAPETSTADPTQPAGNPQLKRRTVVINLMLGSVVLAVSILVSR